MNESLAPDNEVGPALLEFAQLHAPALAPEMGICPNCGENALGLYPMPGVMIVLEEDTPDTRAWIEWMGQTHAVAGNGN